MELSSISSILYFAFSVSVLNFPVTESTFPYSLHKVNLNWTDAQAYCQNIGPSCELAKVDGFLATFQVVGLLNDEANGQKNVGYWIGGRRNVDNRAIFEWKTRSTSTPFSMSVFWGHDLPDDYGYGAACMDYECGENGAEYRDFGGGWIVNDYVSDRKQGCICRC